MIIILAFVQMIMIQGGFYIGGVYFDTVYINIYCPFHFYIPTVETVFVSFSFGIRHHIINYTIVGQLTDSSRLYKSLTFKV